MVTKQDIRTTVLKKRAQLSEEERLEKSGIIRNKLLQHPLVLQMEHIFCYVDYRHEVETRQFIEELWTIGKRVAVPKVCGDEMKFFYIHQWDDLKKGYCGILEPDSCEEASCEEALILMPGSAFDFAHNRIGYGKGFYDTYLKNHPAYRTIAIAFELQMVEHIPADPHDICPEEIITEEHHYV